MTPTDSGPALTCPKCGTESGDDWSHCEGGPCPMEGSPYYQQIGPALKPSDEALEAACVAYASAANETHAEGMRLARKAWAWRLEAISPLDASKPSDEAQVPRGDPEIEAMCKAFADATGYYVEFHRGLRSVSSDKYRVGMKAAIEALRALEATPQNAGEAKPVAWGEDPTADEGWNAGCQFAQDQLCKVLGVDPHSIDWDAATETLDGDVQSVTCKILTAGLGDDWQDIPKINAMLDEGQGGDDGAQILPDFSPGMSLYAKVEACLFLLEKRRDVIEAYAAPPHADLVAAAQEVTNFAWSMVTLPNATSREYLNGLLTALRAALTNGGKT